MNKIISFDIGGTSCKWALFNEKSVIELNDKFSTEKITKASLLKAIAKIVNAHDDKNLMIAISSPTAINTKTGYAYGISGIKGYENFNLYNELKPLLKYDNKIIAVNDANAALLGTLFLEESKPENATLITFGTGIGGAIYLNNSLLIGKNGFAGEFGYGNIFANDKNLSRNCSTYALTSSLSEYLGRKIDGFEVWNLYRDNVQEVVLMVNRWIFNIATFLTFVIYSLNIDVIYIGGGISSEPLFLKLINEKIMEILQEENLKEIMPEIRKAKGGNDAALYGAMSLWKK